MWNDFVRSELSLSSQALPQGYNLAYYAPPPTFPESVNLPRIIDCLFTNTHIHTSPLSSLSAKMRLTQITILLSTTITITVFGVDLRHLVIPPSGTVTLQEFCTDWLSTCQT